MLAEKTLRAIEVAIHKDQGNTYRGHLKKLLLEAEDIYRQDEGGFRSHLGASLIGRPCDRELWLNFHWAKRPEFEGRVLRLFNRGHMEEPRLIAALLTIGCKFWHVDNNGHQFRISGVGGHYGSAIDGVAKGIPDMPDEVMLTEFKTHGDKSFQKLKAERVRKAKLEHYVQMNQYMGEYKLNYALYLAVNKNDDELYAEIVPFDRDNYEAFKKRAKTVILAKAALPRINNSPAWFACRFCDFHSICHGAEQPEVNCRTCKWSEALEDGRWVCHKHDGANLSKEDQLRGCKDYEVNQTIKAK